MFSKQEKNDAKPKHKKKAVVQLVTNWENSEDEDISNLIRESVKEALHKEPERTPVVFEKQKVNQQESPV